MENKQIKLYIPPEGETIAQILNTTKDKTFATLDKLLADPNSIPEEWSDYRSILFLGNLFIEEYNDVRIKVVKYLHRNKKVRKWGEGYYPITYPLEFPVAVAYYDSD